MSVDKIFLYRRYAIIPQSDDSPHLKTATIIGYTVCKSDGSILCEAKTLDEAKAAVDRDNPCRPAVGVSPRFTIG